MQVLSLEKLELCMQYIKYIHIFFFLQSLFIFSIFALGKEITKKFEMFFSSLLTMKFKCLRIGILPLHFLSSIHLS